MDCTDRKGMRRRDIGEGRKMNEWGVLGTSGGSWLAW